MRQNPNGRIIKVSKQKLIDQIKANKEAHIKNYEDAKKAYIKEAERQLKEQKKKLAKGEYNLSLNLISPADKSEDYDKLIKMFEWDLEDEVELTQGEFNQYVHDEFEFAIRAKLLNASYLS